ncbi:MAG: (Fe-S)-binding protein [Candidatus Odinarchaeota archaeon]|nr:(Fe-S)-binding protein [Candidatus Odinarchaeota archaeon]
MSYESLVKESDRNFEYIRFLLYNEYKLAQFSSDDFEELSAFDNCINCGLCISVCPVVRVVGVERFPGPRSIGISISRALQNIIEMRDALFECTGCNACNEICPQKIPIKQIVIRLKDKLRKIEPKAIPKDVIELTKPLTEVKMFYQPKDSEKKKKIVRRQLEKLGLPYIEDKFDANANVLLYPGCKAEERLYAMKEGAKIVLDKVGAKWTLMDTFICCGYPAEEKGNLDELQYLQNELLKQIKKLKNIKVIVTICPGCTSSIKRLIEKSGLDVKVKYIVRYLIEDIGIESIKKLIREKEKMIVALQAPCNLYRETDPEILHLTEYLLKQIGNITIVHLLSETMCCGGGAFIPVTNKDISNKILKHHILELKNSDATRILTMCPECYTQWSQGIRIFLKHEKEPLDISILLAKLIC